MKTIKFTAFLFYRYYSTGATKAVPYFSTLCALVMMTNLHLFQLAIMLHQVDNLIPVKSNDPKWQKYLVISFVLLPFFLLFSLIIKPRDLKQLTYSAGQIKKGNVTLVVYLILSMILLIILILFFPRTH